MFFNVFFVKFGAFSFPERSFVTALWNSNGAVPFGAVFPDRWVRELSLPPIRSLGQHMGGRPHVELKGKARLNSEFGKLCLSMTWRRVDRKILCDGRLCPSPWRKFRSIFNKPWQKFRSIFTYEADVIMKNSLFVYDRFGVTDGAGRSKTCPWTH